MVHSKTNVFISFVETIQLVKLECLVFFFFQELEEQLAEQKKLLQSVASRGEEILIQQASPSSLR